MASVSGSNSSYSSLSSQIRGYGGLASGLDRDTLIEQMTSGTRAKIAKQGQQKTKLEWQMEAMRDITSKIYGFTSNYTSYASPNNLLSSTLFSRNKVTAVGENSKYVSVTGTAAGAENMSIAGVKQLASNARLTTGTVSNRTLDTGMMMVGADGKMSVKTTVSTIAGDAFYIKYGNKNYTVKLPDTDDYNYSMENNPETNKPYAIESIQKALDNVTIGSGTDAQKLGDIVKVEMDGTKIKFTADESKAHGNAIMFNGGTGNVLQDLGIVKTGQDFSDLDDEEKTITKDGLTGTYDAKLTEEKTLAQRLSGSQISFNYNGEIKWITLDKYEDTDTLDKVKEDLQKKLDDAYGKGRIEVSNNLTTFPGDTTRAIGSLSFKTVKKGGAEDGSSTLSITSGAGIVGKSGAFGILAGASNRVNLSASLKDSGLAASDKFKPDASGNYELEDAKGNYNLTINGKKVEGITRESTVKEIIDKINATEGIGVTVSYQEMSDRFVVTATGKGTSGDIVFDEADTANGEKENIAKYLFGDRGTANTAGAAGADVPAFSYEEGQDAIISVKYPGSDEAIEITRGSNTFSLDGLNVTLKGEFGYKKAADGSEELVLDDTTEAITFDASVDADKTVEAVKGMVDSFNEILELVNNNVKTKPDRDYSPLTDEQKEEMSESQIEKWEAKAKEGILFADMDLRMMADNLRTVINSGNTTELSAMGITVSTNYSDNGKLVFEEAKFRTALQNDPDAVRSAFTRAIGKDESGKVTTQGGLMVTMKNIMDKYGSTTGATKGILIERAGSIYAPTSILSNSLQKQLDRIDDYIEQLQDKLETETDRYISQFTSLETLISQMNNQSSYLSSMFS